MTTIGTAVLEIIPSLRGVSDAIDKGTRDLKITPRIDTSGARSSGQQAGKEINSGLQSANIGQGVSSSLGANLLRGAESAGREMGSLIATGLKSTAIAGGALAIAGIAGALHAGFSRLTAIDDARFKLQGLGNDAVKVQAIMDNALAAVKGTAFGLDEAATTAASAVAAGIAPGKQLTDYLKLTADTAAIAGTSLADMGAIFNKVQTSGKAFTGDLNMLSDRGLPVFQWLQDEYKVSGEALSKMVSDGKVDAATFQKVVAEHISGAAQNMGGSIRGQLSNLKASYSRFGAELAGPIFAAVSPLTTAFTGAFDKVTTAIKPFTAKLTAIIGPWATDLGNKITAWLDNGGVQKIVEWFGRLGDTFSRLTSGGGSAELDKIGDAIKGMGPVLQQVGPALSAFGQAIVAVGPQTLTDFLVPALKVFGNTLQFVADHASWAVPVLGGLVLAFAGFKVVGDTVAPIFNALNGAFKIINTPIMLAQTAAIRAQAAAMTELSAALSVNTVAAGENAAVSLGGAATAAKGLATEAGTAAIALGGLGGAAEKGAGGIIAALSKVAIPAWLAYLIGQSPNNPASPTFVDPKNPNLPPIVTGQGLDSYGDSIVKRAQEQGLLPTPPKPQAPAPPVNVDTNSPLGKLLFPYGRATGGSIFGAGTATSDSIPAMLSNGEHVWTADEVNKLGGQGAMYRLRGMVKSGLLKGFDSGGPVLPNLLDIMSGRSGQRDNWAENTLFDPMQRLLLYRNMIGVDPSGLRTPGGGIFNSGMRIDTSNVSVSPPPKFGYDQNRVTFDDLSDLTTYQKGEFNNPTYFKRKAISNNDPLWSWIQEQGGGFAGGGAVGPDVAAAEALVGTPYSMAKRFDCSGDVARVISTALGISGGGLMTTANAGQWLSALGFKPGVGGPGAISVGWKNGGPGGGHMAMTLSDGRNAEGGGSHPNFLIGGSVGASSAQFTDHMYLALAAASIAQAATSGQGDDTSAVPSGAGQGSGVSLPSSLSGLSGFGLSGLGKGIGTTGSGSDLSLFGNAAASAVTGQASSLLGAFGISDNPPILQAASQLLGGISIGGQGGSASPLAARSTTTGAIPPDDAGNMHGTRANQQPGPVFNTTISAFDTTDAVALWDRKKNQMVAAKLSAY